MKFMRQAFLNTISFWKTIKSWLRAPVFWVKPRSGAYGPAVVLFPFKYNILACGLVGIVDFLNLPKKDNGLDVSSYMNEGFWVLQALEDLKHGDQFSLESLDKLLDWARGFRREQMFCAVFNDANAQDELKSKVQLLNKTIVSKQTFLSRNTGRFGEEQEEILTGQLEILKDISWMISSEILGNMKKIRELMPDPETQTSFEAVETYKKLNAALNSLDRLEVRGRDSAGISIMFLFDAKTFARFEEKSARLEINGADYISRKTETVLLNRNITIRKHETGETALALVYKVAAEVGALGDNVRFLRDQIRNDTLLGLLAERIPLRRTIQSHTRWASVGAITEANCHPVDNLGLEPRNENPPIVHVVLNGDIDNYLELKNELVKQGRTIHEDLTSDTVIIAYLVEQYLNQGFDVKEAFRRTVNRCAGSHAICMHTDVASGKLFLAQKGSGQALFVGLGHGLYMPSSEVYGFVEETNQYLKLDGEKEVDGVQGKTRGQIFVLDQNSAGGLEGIDACYYDGTLLPLSADDIKTTQITSRDIDRQDFPHYFLKEITESPVSVEKTLQNRWIVDPDTGYRKICLNASVVPPKIKKAFVRGDICRIFFMGQGTAGVAASACAHVLQHYIQDPGLQIRALKSSEFSGFALDERDDPQKMADTLVIAISQSGTTTDTNKTVDMARQRGAHTIAIVNRRDSDITFKVDGVFYTSSGRDIEMSVASTKAFYSQIVAGAVLGLYLSEITNQRDKVFISDELGRLLDIGNHMKTVLNLSDKIQESAARLAPSTIYWATVGSGPNKAAADEIRIKLSELCYKTISSDFVEDKKHIDLSSEPLILVCAAGTRETVLGDIVKDCAIFKAHKASPIIIANQGDHRFDNYGEDIFYVPFVPEHLAPILNTLVGHIWGYYAALAINGGARFLYQWRQRLQSIIDQHTADGMDIYEIVLEKRFREKMALFYAEFNQWKTHGRLPVSLGLEAAADLPLLLKYLSGRLPVSDFEPDFGKKGTPLNMLETLFESMGEAINKMTRPVDAIKHQAKTVTVGTSRIREKLEGLLFDALSNLGFSLSQITAQNALVLRNLQGIIEKINGALLYEVGGLNLLGEPTEESWIRVLKKTGIIEKLVSRVETDSRLKGTKRIIVREGNVYMGMGRKDKRSIVIIPVISGSGEGAGRIDRLLLLNISFFRRVPLDVRITALGGKFERIKNIVQENNVKWEDRLLNNVPMEDLFGLSAERIADGIVPSSSARI